MSSSFSGIIGCSIGRCGQVVKQPIAVAAACERICPKQGASNGIDDTIERRRASELQLRVSIVTQSVPVATWSKPVVCGG